MDIETAYFTAAGWNNTLPDPLADKEVRTTVESIFKTHERNHPGSQIDGETADIEEKNNLMFPSQVLTGLAGKFARLYGNHLEPPEHFFYMTFLTNLGAVLADHLSLNTEIQPQPRLFTRLLPEQR